MTKALSIALTVLIVTLLVPAAHAQTAPQPPPLSPIEKQEIGRANDPRLFNTGRVTPVEVAGPSDSFDYSDAGVGGALALSLVAIVGAVLLVGNGRRRRRSASVAASST